MNVRLGHVSLEVLIGELVMNELQRFVDRGLEAALGLGRDGAAERGRGGREGAPSSAAEVNFVGTRKPRRRAVAPVAVFSSEHGWNGGDQAAQQRTGRDDWSR